MTWVLLILVLILPAVAFWLAFLWIPSPNEPPRWRTALAARLEHVADALRHRQPVATDPFQALRVQERLGAVADHVRALEVDPHTFARAERIIASQLAYDQLLAEACKMAGVEVLACALGDAQERFREEVELASRGWSW
jgi:aminoglycoside phosphotransferase